MLANINHNYYIQTLVFLAPEYASCWPAECLSYVLTHLQRFMPFSEYECFTHREGAQQGHNIVQCSVEQAPMREHTCNKRVNTMSYKISKTTTGRVLIIHNRGDWRSVMYSPILCIIQQGIAPHRVVPHFSWFFTLFVAPVPVSR